MSSFDDFIWQNYGAYLDFDGYAGPQCVDLYRYYLRDVLGVPQTPPVTGANQIFDNAPAATFLKIVNTPNGVPIKGDIMIWNTNAGGGYGHVGVVRTADVNKFTSLDQNWPVGGRCQKVLHNYNNVRGWLRRK